MTGADEQCSEDCVFLYGVEFWMRNYHQTEMSHLTNQDPGERIGPIIAAGGTKKKQSTE